MDLNGDYVYFTVTRARAFENGLESSTAALDLSIGAVELSTPCFEQKSNADHEKP